MDRQLSGAIIAAGTGSRLRGASGNLPKPLVGLNGETLLERQLRLLEAAGAGPLNVIVNSETAKLIEALELSLPRQLGLMVRDTPNSMESLLALSERIPTGWFLLMTVDAVVSLAELQRFVTSAVAKTSGRDDGTADGVLGVVTWRGDKHPLFAEVADDGSVGRLGGQSSSLVTAGVYLFSTRIFEFAAEARELGLDAMRRYLALLLTRGIKLAAIQLADVIDVDEGEDLRAAQALISNS
jgi:NDP-sugar pyrophosphorylase family protein